MTGGDSRPPRLRALRPSGRRDRRGRGEDELTTHEPGSRERDPERRERHRLHIDESGDHVFRHTDEPGHRYLCLLGCFMRDDAYLSFHRDLGEFKQRHIPHSPDEPVTLRDQIHRRIQSITGIRATVELVAPRTLERSAGKPQRVIDHRAERKQTGHVTRPFAPEECLTTQKP